jgi:predicted alpha-1,6-mannanase (GH76 family)
VELKRLNAKALMLARCTRGFLHRQAARAARRQLNLARQRKAFAGCATVLQKRYRAFHSRRYTHDYYARKAYLAVLLHKGEAVRKALAEQMQAEAEQRRSQAEEQVRRGFVLIWSRRVGDGSPQTLGREWQQPQG